MILEWEELIHILKKMIVHRFLRSTNFFPLWFQNEEGPPLSFKEEDNPKVLETNQIFITISERRGIPLSYKEDCMKKERGKGVPLHFELKTRKMMVAQSYLRQTTFIRTKVSERKGNPPTPLLSLLLLVSIIHGHSNHTGMCLKT